MGKYLPCNFTPKVARASVYQFTKRKARVFANLVIEHIEDFRGIKSLVVWLKLRRGERRGRIYIGCAHILRWSPDAKYPL